MQGTRVRHMVVFTLFHASTDPRTAAFLADGERLLKGIPGVQSFEVVRQVSPKSDYTYGFSMEFEDQAAYNAYNTHPVHVGFVNERWLPEVAKFQEIDFAAL